MATPPGGGRNREAIESGLAVEGSEMNPGTYRAVRGVLAWLLAAAAAAACGAPGQPEADAAVDGAAVDGAVAPVAVDGGLVGGVAGRVGSARLYGSIPYAAPPVGERRWRPPQPVEAWSGVRDGSQLPPACMQPELPVPPGEQPFFGAGSTRMSEDCLHLNVWTAAQPGDALPVLVWIHGGGLFVGDGATSAYDGSLLAARGAVVVTINYRLGALGYLTHALLRAESPHDASGNYGLLDQVAALEWVQRNIAAFGGDPGRVTIFGESAGSWSVNYLMATPLARGLFAGAIGQSGGAFAPAAGPVPRETAEAAGERLVAAVLEPGVEPTLDALRAVPAATLLASAPPGVVLNVDGWVLPASVREIFARGEQHDVPVIIGANADEGTALAALAGGAAPDSVAAYGEWARSEHGELADAFLAAYPAESAAEVGARVVDSAGDARFVWEMRTWARMMDSVSSPAYLYFFERTPPAADAARYGAYHTAEIPYVFGNLDGGGRYWFANRDYDDTDRELSDAMSGYWLNFAATGDPNGAGLPRWPAYNHATDEWLVLGDSVQVRADVRRQRLDFFDQRYGASDEN